VRNSKLALGISARYPAKPPDRATR
jgi:hypothetical protein